MIDGIRVPRFLYGTAWKEDSTLRLTELALQQGFRGVDTANQRRHYDEASVGRGIAAAITNGLVTREDLFLQTKFTFPGGQDHRLPYDANAPVMTQVAQSFASSLAHLGSDVIDSYLLHGPTRRVGLARTDWDAWRAMETIHDSGKVSILGISNVTVDQAHQLYAGARVKPRFVQNRCYASRGWDLKVRQFCAANDIVYQGFSLLTANRPLLVHPELIQIAKRHGRTTSQIVFRFALQIGILPLTGTSNRKHMQEDLAVFDFELEPEEIQLIQQLG